MKWVFILVQTGSLIILQILDLINGRDGLHNITQVVTTKENMLCGNALLKEKSMELMEMSI